MTLALGEQVTVSSGDNGYFLVESERDQVHSVQLIHHDATSEGTWTVYSSNRSDAPIPAAEATPDVEYWSAESPTITSPTTASAAGSFMLHLSASAARKYLVRFAATDDSELSVYPHSKASA